MKITFAAFVNVPSTLVSAAIKQDWRGGNDIDAFLKGESMNPLKNHWENVYQNKKPGEVSWFQPRLNQSLDLILQSRVNPEVFIIDVGGGASTLVDDLLDKGYTNLSVLDLSAAALEVSKKRLGSKVKEVDWIEGDITAVKLPEKHYNLWHDRAVFHFLTAPHDRKGYLENLNRSLKVGGHLILATFSLKGPERCSGLDIVRYSPETLQIELGRNYHLLNSLEESHKTPFGTTQEFIYCLFQHQG